MKRINCQLLFLTGMTVLLSSCYKKFDTKSYSPPLDIGGFSSSSEVASANLVAHWSFNGSIIDSVSGSSGINSGTTFTTGIKGQALQGGTSSYVVFDPGTTIKNLQSYTISFWINSPTNTGAIGIFTLSNPNDFWGNLDIYQDNGGSGNQAVFKVHMNNTNVPWAGQFTDTKINFGTWNNIAITYNATTSIFNIYQNGVALGVNSAGNPANTVGPRLNGSDPSSPPVTPYGALHFATPGKIAFGAFQFQTNPSLTGSAGAQSWASNFTGALDEFRIYNRALTASEVSSLVKLEGRGK
jgi:hypothetical protein